ncbi:MAG TPA: hypothetical protein VMW43_11700 [Bacteroidota bacterium]|nr:hypothetical protein [Bacteroidota bacterium]
MKMRTNLLLIVTVILLCRVPLIAQDQQVIDPKSLSLTSDGPDVKISWQTLDETGVKEFDVMRSSTGADNDFRQIGSVAPLHASVYFFIDHSAFKKTVSSTFYYKITTVFSTDHAPVTTAEKEIEIFVSSVRRTWGSIKSMFRF